MNDLNRILCLPMVVMRSVTNHLLLLFILDAPPPPDTALLIPATWRNAYEKYVAERPLFVDEENNKEVGVMSVFMQGVLDRLVKKINRLIEI